MASSPYDGRVIGLLFLAFIVVPIVELYVIIQVGSAIGALQTITLLIVIGVIGAWLVKREGRNALARIQQQLRVGQLPANEVIDGGLILFAGALMLTPGFITDLLAISLLFPPTRAVVRGILRRRFRVTRP